MEARCRGCTLCHKGAKMVLFVTGRCGRTCWYCPISSERRGRDVIYANDRRVERCIDIIDEAEIMSALGTGITGGEPFLVFDRVVEISSLLKRTFGKEHHIHLYTGIAPARQQLQLLAGLVDEIRFHPPVETWEHIMQSAFTDAIQDARECGFSVGIEVPSLPALEHLLPVLPLLDFMNINELEWSETNAEAMRNRNYSLEDSHHNAVKGMKKFSSKLLRDRKVYWCSSTFKDSVQLRERLKRIALNTARKFDEITEDGTILYGVLEPAGRPVNLDPDLMEYCDDHIEMAWWILIEQSENLPGKKYIVERYPNGGMVVEVIPL